MGAPREIASKEKSHQLQGLLLQEVTILAEAHLEAEAEAALIERSHQLQGLILHGLPVQRGARYALIFGTFMPLNDFNFFFLFMQTF